MPFTFWKLPLKTSPGFLVRGFEWLCKFEAVPEQRGAAVSLKQCVCALLGDETGRAEEMESLCMQSKMFFVGHSPSELV